MSDRRKHDGGHEEEHENHERWLLTYADMITLLMALFIVMYAISSLNKSKFEAFQSSLSQNKATGQPEITAPNPLKQPVEPKPGNPVVGQNEDPILGEDQLKALKALLESDLAKAGMSGAAQLSIDSRGLAIVLTDGVLFDSAQIDLLTGGQKVLRVIAPRLKHFKNAMVIEGHTDNRPISVGVIRSNWYLSLLRAASVLDYLRQLGVPEDQITPTGKGDSKPKVPNDTDAHRAQNRRVVVLIKAQAPATTTAAAPAAAEPAAEAKSESSSEH
jgi:chemotaxis protein MotB